jgi:enoyl-CoA hydratase
MSDTVLETVSRSDPRPGVAVLTMNRPDRLNAMNHDLIAGLHAALAAVHNDRSCRAVIITGAGRGFSAGLDLRDGAAVPGTEHLGRAQANFATQQHLASLIPHLREVRQPVIAAVNGPASGAGLALALGCDVRLAAPTAKFNVAFVRIGLSGCDIGVSWMLPRLIGAAASFELLLTGRIIDATEAHRIGIVNRVIADGTVLDAALDVADEIAANSPFGVWMTKEVMWSQLEVGSLKAGIDLENRTQVLAATTKDMREAASAFVEKRVPAFRDA